LIVLAGIAVAFAVALAVSDQARSAGRGFPGGQGLIVFSRQTGSETDIAAVRPDRTGLTVLVPNAGAPSWSADGRHLAFARRTDRGDWDLFVAKADGSDERELVDEGSDEVGPAWSPDGAQLVYVGYPARQRDGELFVVNLDGSGRRQLTQDGQDSTTPMSPKWSPNGELIAFTEDGVVRIVKSDGSGERDLAGDGTVGSVSWSPDGTKILYDAAGYGNGRGAWDDLYVAAADGRSPAHAITHTLAYESDAEWSPDGTAIVYTVWRTRNGRNTGHGDLYLIRADGSKPRPLVRGRASKWGADWQPLDG
jgi:TolB protein